MLTHCKQMRALVAILAMFGQQVTGQPFQSQYSVIFYQEQGCGSQAFLFGVIGNVVALATLILTWFIVHSVGRRSVIPLSLLNWLYR